MTSSLCRAVYLLGSVVADMSNPARACSTWLAVQVAALAIIDRVGPRSFMLGGLNVNREMLAVTPRKPVDPRGMMTVNSLLYQGVGE
jgi:hypothetical protein